MSRHDRRTYFVGCACQTMLMIFQRPSYLARCMWSMPQEAVILATAVWSITSRTSTFLMVVSRVPALFHEAANDINCAKVMVDCGSYVGFAGSRQNPRLVRSGWTLRSIRVGSTR